MQEICLVEAFHVRGGSFTPRMSCHSGHARDGHDTLSPWKSTVRGPFEEPITQNAALHGRHARPDGARRVLQPT
jgi:hypothetical protein